MVKSLTIAQAKSLKHGQTVRMIGWYDSSGIPSQCRVSGKVQTWKTRPDDFRVPIKRGLYENGEIVPSNIGMFTLEYPKSVPKSEVHKGRHVKRG